MGDLATMDELVCPKCHRFGCKCDVSAVASPLAQICPVCKRNKVVCICISHAPYAPPREAEGSVRRTTSESQVNAALGYYYNRDAAGLERFVRELLR
jgi:hypothetical protein